MPASNDLLNKRFEKSNFGGYKTTDVDSFMAELAHTLSQDGRETSELKRKLEAAEKRLESYENEEDSLKSTLLSAQRLADKIVKEANDKAQLTIKAATENAELTIRDSKIKSENLISCAQSEVEIRKNEAARIKREVSDFKLSVMRLYKAQLELINDIPAEDPVPTQDEQRETADQSEPQHDNELPDKTVAQEPVKTLKETPEEAPPEIHADEDLKSDEAGADAVKQQPSAASFKGAVQEQYQEQEQPAETERVKREAAASTMQTVKLNLRYNKKTGEYEPIGEQTQGTGESAGLSSKQSKDADNLKFGAGYDVHTDSFDGASGRHRLWHK